MPLNMFHYVSIFHVFDNVMYLFGYQINVHVQLCIVCIFCIYHSFCCNMNLYFGPAALYYRINRIYEPYL